MMIRHAHLGVVMSLLVVAPMVLGKTPEYQPIPSLEIEVIDILPGLEDVVGLKSAAGAYVLEGQGHPPSPNGVLPDRIMAGDLIVALAGESTPTSQALDRVVASKKPGDKVQVKVIRGGGEVLLSIVIGSSPPIIYLPADTCPSLTVPMAPDFLGKWMSGSVSAGVFSSSASSVCRFPALACSPMQLRKQSEKRTVVEINGFSHEILGDWRAHTYVDRQECLVDKKRLEGLRERGAN